MTSTTATETNNGSGDKVSQPQDVTSPTNEVVDVSAVTSPTETKDGLNETNNKSDEKSAGKMSGDNADEQTSPKKPAMEPKPVVHHLDWTKDVVYVYQFPRCPTIPSASPFCLLVETWLRMAQIQYENIDHRMKFKSKKGQLPFVEVNGKEIADSHVIVRELSQHFDKNMDSGLTPDQRNVSHAFESMLNNHTSWVVRWWRYNNPGDFIKASQLDIKRTLNSKLPRGVINFFFKIGLHSNVKQAIGHGLGRHSTEEIYDFGKSDLQALSQHLDDKEYFFGKDPHVLDCVAFAHLCQFIYVPFGGINEWMATETPNLIEFVNRVKDQYWPDWDEIGKTLAMNTHLPKKESQQDDEIIKADDMKKKKEIEREEKKKEKEEKKKELAEKKRKEKEEREARKKEEKEKAEKEKQEKLEKEKAEKEKLEKEKAEKLEKEKAEKEAEEKKDEPVATEKTDADTTEVKKDEPEAKVEDKKEPETKDDETK